MLLVPRQLLRSGMTGNVPYYGGRFTPAQAYAASHPTAPPAGRQTGPQGVAASHAPLPAAPAPAAPAPAPATTGRDAQAALVHLRDTGVLSTEEYDELLTRTHR